MTTAIRIENVSKLYRLGTVGTGTIAHDLNRWWHQIRGKEDPYAKLGQVNDRTKKSGKSSVTSRQSWETATTEDCQLPADDSREAGPEYVWALRDINLEVQQGEILGIIGRNGAGKSTLLKLLSRVTAPTTGSIKTKGRIASLLEVGTGFHGDLTGRENIFLNGAILGMKKHQIRTQLEGIIDFSGCEKYIDTPVKRYSSGMYVRLAFAVAAHLDPDILIVDEVLAVGDAAFQKKCIGKLKDVAGDGRTILFVSHNFGPILQICSQVVYMDRGQVLSVGNARETVEKYLSDSGPEETGRYAAVVPTVAKDILIESAESCGDNGEVKARFTHNENINIRMRCRIKLWPTGAELRMIVRDGSMRTVFTTDAELDHIRQPECSTAFATVTIPAVSLRPGCYWFTFAVFIPDAVVFDLAENVFSITVIDGGSKWSKSEGLDYGCVFLECDWRIAPSE